MLSQRLANIVFAAALVAASGVFAWIAEGFEAQGLLAESGLPSKFFPQLTLACVAACALAVFVDYARKGASGGDGGRFVFVDAGEARRGLSMLAAAAACYVVWLRFGFVPMAASLGPLCLLAMGIRDPWKFFAVWALTGLVCLAFVLGLGVRLG